MRGPQTYTSVRDDFKNPRGNCYNPEEKEHFQTEVNAFPDALRQRPPPEWKGKSCSAKEESHIEKSNFGPPPHHIKLLITTTFVQLRHICIHQVGPHSDFLKNYLQVLKANIITDCDRK